MQLFLKTPSGMANTIDYDQTAPSDLLLKEQSDLGLHCLLMSKKLWCTKF